MRKPHSLALACLGLVGLPTAAPALAARPGQGADPFRSLPVEEAQQLARQQERLLLLAFYEADCGPCGEWDRTVFTNGDVRAWLAEKTVALRLLEAHELEARHAIGVRPTILVLGPDGEEVERLDTLLQPQDFLAAIRAALEAGSGHEADRRRSNEARSHVDQGRRLAREGRGAEALQHFLRALDCTREVPSWADARLGGLLGEIAALFPAVPEARSELVQRREVVTTTLLESHEPPLPGAELTLSARELEAFDRTLADLEHLRQVWQTLRQRESTSPLVLEILFSDSLQLYLLDSKRFEELLSGVGDPLVALEQRLARVQRLLPEAQHDANQRSLVTFERNAGINLAGRCYEALLGLRREAEANGVAQLLLGLEPRAQSYLALAIAAKRAGHSEWVTALIERGMSTLPEAERGTLESLAKALLPDNG